MPTELNDTDFSMAVGRCQQPVLVLAYASWCVDSRKILPVFERAANSGEFGGVAFVQVEIEANPGVKTTLGVERYPTLYVFKNGEKVEEQIAEVPEKEQEAIIGALVRKALGLETGMRV